MRITKHVMAALDRALEMEHAGGFYTANRIEYNRLERMRQAGLLKFYNGRRCRCWAAQYFTITDAGRAVRVDVRSR